MISGKCSAENTNWSCCSTSHKCDENQGDCDNDSHCKSGLKCGTDNCPLGFPNKAYDCCYKPKPCKYNFILIYFNADYEQLGILEFAPS